ncbi:uncharacterized protein PAF06_013938 [Gastrophryne carolinensis]
MASAALGDELSCSICLSFYTEPVSLRCGHNFCQSCIGTVLEMQEESGIYSCPECREEYKERPALEKNRKLCNIVENFRSTQMAEIHCTYCVETPVVAVKSCLQCEMSLCEKHLTIHNAMVDHVLVEPTSSLRSNKCLIHKKLLEYFCSEDAVCLCVSCCLVGKHKGHQVELLDEASEKKKKTLRGILKKITSKDKDFGERIQSLQEHKKKVQDKAGDEKTRVNALFQDIRDQLEVQQKKVLGEISRQEDGILQSILEKTRKLEAKKDALSKDVSHIEELCNVADPISVLQDQQLSILQNKLLDPEDLDEKEPSIADLDVLLISRVLDQSIDDVFGNIKTKTNILEPDLLIEENYALSLVVSDEESETYTNYFDEIGWGSHFQRSDPHPHQLELVSFLSPLLSTMASAELRDELTCAVCLSIYREPVSLGCGHSFCHECIGKVLEAQFESVGTYSCPECREEYPIRPSLVRNRKLCNIARQFTIRRSPPEGSGVSCTYCADAAVPAAKTCLQCEISLCDHHNSAVDHVLVDPTNSLDNSKCQVHSKLLEYYCYQDGACICVSCFAVGSHRKHQVETLNEAMTKKKERLRKLLEDLTFQSEDAEKKVCSLQEVQRTEQEKVADLRQKCNVLFADTRKQLDEMEANILTLIADQEEKIVSQISGWETEKDLLSKTMRRIEDLCATADPLVILQDKESDRQYFGGGENLKSATNAEDNPDLRHDPGLILVSLHAALSNFVTKVKKSVYVPETTGMSLDVNTAANSVLVSGDLKFASWVNYHLGYLQNSKRFVSSCQMLCKEFFFKGEHYWEVDTSESDYWTVGMASASIAREGKLSKIGNNTKSWCLKRSGNGCCVMHNSKMTALNVNSPLKKLGIYLDYEGGRLSFYQLCDPIRCLHTFTTSFTEPLYPAFSVWKNGWIRIKKLRDELTCAVCLSIYREPVSLGCGHSFCHECIGKVLEAQVESVGIYSCPECREEYPKRPSLVRNRKLCNIARQFTIRRSPPEGSGVSCTYCANAAVPAAKTCLQCEISLCDQHLNVHNSAVDHVLIDPTSSLDNRKCQVHRKLLEYYCYQDGACICVSCFAVGSHRKHQVETLNEAMTKKKERLRKLLEELTFQSEDAEKKVCSLQEVQRTEQEKVVDLRQKCNVLFADTRKQLDEMEANILTLTADQEEKIVSQISGLISGWETQKDLLSKTMRRIEDLCATVDPLVILQDKESDSQYFGGGENLKSATNAEDNPDLRHDPGLIIVSLHAALSNFVTKVKKLVYVPETTGLSLDVDTATNNVLVSEDLKSASWVEDPLGYLQNTKRFVSFCQVLCKESFFKGEHYWEVDTSESDYWTVGMAYDSIAREGKLSKIGNNTKSWCLNRSGNGCYVIHDSRMTALNVNHPLKKLGIYLDYEGGRLSFYQLCGPITCLHTFTTSFIEPLTPNSQSSARLPVPMASAELKDELNCSICLHIYAEPVTLRCGHSFCLGCIRSVLDAQQGLGAYSCPECRAEYPRRPALQRNMKLCNIVEHFRSSNPEQKKSGVYCTYCVQHPIPAVKTCLMCEASLCEVHLSVHSKSVDHILTEPTGSIEGRKCSAHDEILKYFCCKDVACICVSCCVFGEHRGHRVELLQEASEKKKGRLRNVLEKLTWKRDETEKNIQQLQEHRKAVQERALEVTAKVSAWFIELQEQLKALEQQVLADISRLKEKVALSVSDLIQELEMKKDELSRKMSHIEELCRSVDPIAVLQGREFVKADYDDGSNPKPQAIDDLDEVAISLNVTSALADIVANTKRGFKVQELLLNAKTAAVDVAISGDLKSATWSKTPLWAKTPLRFKNYCQVMSFQNFNAGQHYWEVDTSELGNWRVGVAYPTMERKGDHSGIGQNNKSWCLRLCQKDYLVAHGAKETKLEVDSFLQRLGIYLDYEAGRLSFYQLGDHARHLHTFTATFSEPLHAAFLVWKEGWVRIRS